MTRRRYRQGCGCFGLALLWDVTSTFHQFIGAVYAHRFEACYDARPAKKTSPFNLTGWFDMLPNFVWHANIDTVLPATALAFTRHSFYGSFTIQKVGVIYHNVCAMPKSRLCAICEANGMALLYDVPADSPCSAGALSR